MAYNEYLQERIESLLNDKKVVYSAKKMMGGLCYMLDDKMCFASSKINSWRAWAPTILTNY